jgi:DNA mismatch repair protein MSH5
MGEAWPSLDRKSEPQYVNAFHYYQPIIDPFQVDFEQSIIEHRTVIKSNIDGDLDGMKREWDALEDMLSHISRHLQSTLPLPDRSLNVIYFPQIGFLMAAEKDLDDESESPLAPEPDGWTRQFTTEYVAHSR